MKKIISILACVCLLLSAMVIPVSAADGVTITFDANKANRTSYSTEQQIWEQNGIKVTNNKNGSTSNVGDYADPGRFYKSTEVIVEYPGMTALVIDHTGLEAKYASWDTSFTDANATASKTNSITTITFATPVDSFTFASMSAQGRAYSMTVYTDGNAPEVEPDEPDVNDDPAADSTLTIEEAIALGLTKGHNTYTDGKYYVSGVIVSVYNDMYGNMYIEDESGNMLTIYGTYDADGTNRYDAMENAPVAGDTVTLYGIIGQYSGSAQMKNAWIIDVIAGDGEPESNDPAADSVLTIEEAIALGASKLHNVYTENKYYVTGTITEVYNGTYGNMYIADDAGNTLTVYGTYSEDGEVRYDAMENAPVAGDTITVYGIIGQYSGTPQMKNGWITAIGTEEEIAVPGIDPEDPIQLAVNATTPAALTEVIVPAGATIFIEAADPNGTLYVTSATGSYMLINGRQNQLTADGEAELVLCGYEVINVYNPSETDEITLYVFLEAGAGTVVGTWDNPEVLELQENPYMPSFPPSAEAQTELADGNEGYFYKIVATEDGTFVINVSAFDAEYNDVGYLFNITNNATSWQSEFIARAAGADDYYDSVEVPVSAGDEIIINAGTFDAENVYSAPAGTLNVRIGFTAPPAVGSQECPEVIETVGDYAATVNEGTQGYWYEWTAPADGTATIIMNDEIGWTYIVNNITSGAYGDTHWYDDDPVVDTTDVQVNEGDVLSIIVNTYDSATPWNAPAGTVNWTIEFAEVSVPGTFEIADVDAVAGKEFTVTIDISNNPGIIGAKLNINYDVDVLELVSAEAGNFTNGSVNVGDEVIPNYNFSENVTDYPYVINWTDPLATENITTNGTFAVLTFRVKASATEGTTEISITFDEDDIVDVDLNNVAFETVNSTVTITVEDTVSGDANGDGKVTGKDYALMLQSINGWDVDIDNDAADVTGDGAVNGRDYALLLQYINGWDVTLK